MEKSKKTLFGKFQLTRPVWGEPLSILVETKRLTISTHSPRVGRTLRKTTSQSRMKHFNSLAPCGANPAIPSAVILNSAFQLTRPVWGEPFVDKLFIYRFGISTHSPRVGRTPATFSSLRALRSFQLTRPVWGEPAAVKNRSRNCPFQLTRPVWGEPVIIFVAGYDFAISTHSPRVGRTSRRWKRLGLTSAFQLTRPVWGEPEAGIVTNIPMDISTHSPRVGRTVVPSIAGIEADHFNSLAPCGANRKRVILEFHERDFNSLAPCGANRKKYTTQTGISKFQLTRPVWGEP